MSWRTHPLDLWRLTQLPKVRISVGLTRILGNNESLNEVGLKRLIDDAASPYYPEMPPPPLSLSNSGLAIIHLFRIWAITCFELSGTDFFSQNKGGAHSEGRQTASENWTVKFTARLSSILRLYLCIFSYTIWL